MRVLVVGGTGNISTGVVKALVQFGHEVTVYNRGKRRGLLPSGVRTKATGSTGPHSRRPCRPSILTLRLT
jgi:nucleoside-diphosphate-sugar epimerase